MNAGFILSRTIQCAAWSLCPSSSADSGFDQVSVLLMTGVFLIQTFSRSV